MPRACPWTALRRATLSLALGWGLGCWGLGWALGAGAASAATSDGEVLINEALALVLQVHPVLVAERGQVAEQARQRTWSSVVYAGYAQKGTDTDPEGLNAGLRVSIPLFDRKRALETAKARVAQMRTEDEIRIAFLTDLQDLGGRAAQVRSLDQAAGFYRDRLAYREQQVAEGLIAAEELWSEVEATQAAENEHRREAGALAAQIEAMARRYGGQEWQRLRALLQRYVQ